MVAPATTPSPVTEIKKEQINYSNTHTLTNDLTTMMTWLIWNTSILKISLKSIFCLFWMTNDQHRRYNSGHILATVSIRKLRTEINALYIMLATFKQWFH